MSLGGVLGSVGSYFLSIGKALFGQLAEKTEQFLETFVKSDLGALAVDAVTYVEAVLPGEASVTQRDAAVTKLKADLTTAGHDLAAFGESTFNWLVETALQAVQANPPAYTAQIEAHKVAAAPKS